MSINIVLDSCVFNKLYLEEEGREDLLDFLDACQENDVQLLAPSLFTYEVLAVASASSFGAGKAYGLISDFTETGFQLIEMSAGLVKRAIAISNIGHPKSGFPSFYDASYHALAVEVKGTFLTSDRRHYAKVKSEGSIELLKNWGNLFPNN